MRFLSSLLSDDRVANISVTTRDCKRSRLRSSDCEQCVQVCPSDAIVLDGGPRILEECMDCGLCVASCPTGVFRSSPETDQHLTSLLRDLRARPKPSGTEGTLVVRCHLAQNKHQHLITVSCLGVISEFTVVIAAALGFREIRLLQGDCSRCRLRTGKLLFDRSLEKARMLLDDLGFENLILRLEQKWKKDAVTRRQFLSGTAVRSRICSTPYLEHVADSRADPQRTGHRGSDNRCRQDARQILIDLLREEVLHGGGFDRPLSWWKLQIDADRCSACAVCARICPTGAIVEESYPDRQLIGLEVMRCTNCGLCIEACPDEAIKFGEPVYIGDCLDGKWNQLVKNRLSPCSVCGDPVTPASSGRCPTCDRRQISLLC